MKLSEYLSKSGLPDGTEVSLEQANALIGAIEAAGVTLLVNNNKEADYLPKSRFDEILGQKKDLEAQLKTVKTDLEAMAKSAGDKEELLKKIEALQATATEAEAKLAKREMEFGIARAALDAQARDPEDIAKFIDTSKLTFKDGACEGLSEQFAALKESKPYLFAEDTTPKGGADGFNGGGSPADLDAQIETALRAGNIAESMRLKDLKYQASARLPDQT